ncbi:DNA polymerase III, beta subunit [Mycoplasmopsis canis UFG4]|uniref:DNA polymerase III, beta subunit n=1 Tax=Mycoplasmopsis canis UFG4 TaxID=1131455 RepID=I1A7G7_9BACT|nr:DNA polymerase III subunit beta [Mycoplasmopsis canis]EIE42438.1 DNA polymerase III, beta subunit [Mycoplasmopsis canis UFG4]
MKFTISKNLLENIIEFLSTFVDSNDSYMLFRGIYIELNNEEATFIAGNSSIASKKTIKIDEKEIKLEKTGSLLINTTILKNLVKKFEKEITFIKNENSLEVFENKTRYTLTLLDETKYSHFNFSIPQNKIAIKSKDLNEAINNVYISSNLNHEKSNNIVNNPVTKVINLRSEGNKIRFTSTDTYRLSTHVLNIGQESNLDINIDVKNFKKLYNKDMPNEINLFIENNRIGISYENTIIFTYIVNIKYIDIDRLIKFENTKNIKIKKEELSKIINKTIFYSSEKIRRLQFSISENEIKTTFEIPEVGISEFITTSLEYSGNSFEIDIDWQFVKEAISAFNTEYIYLHITNNEDRIYIKGEDSDDNVQLLTPIRRY